MINRIDIKKFGCFTNFEWKVALKEGQTIYDFKRLNILYGRNYSGKTTLSRILRSYEVGRPPENFENSKFEIKYGEASFNQGDIQSHPLDIRVYNRDFIDDNLSFLNNPEDGEVKTFAIIGSKNKEIEQQISEEEKNLGSIEAKSGLRYEHVLKNEEYATQKKAADEAAEKLDNTLRRYANDVIKINPDYGSPVYNINKIRRDIGVVDKKEFSILDGAEVQNKLVQLKEEELPDIEEKVSFHPTFSTLFTDSQMVLGREIKPSSPIQGLLNDALLQTWVRAGMKHHRENRTSCGFCGQPLPVDLWEKLDAHFNQESSDLENELNRQIGAIDAEMNAASNIRLPGKGRFYAVNYTLFESKRTDLQKSLKAYQEEVKKIQKQLKRRQNDIFKTVACTDIVDHSGELQRNIEAFNKLIEENNELTNTLTRRQQETRDELRLNAVANFIRDIDLGAGEQNVSKLRSYVCTSKEKVDRLAENIQIIEHKIEQLQTELHDEKKGAEKVNKYLNHYFGHDGLRLQAVEDPAESRFKFQIMRGDDPAYNMSEGERGLVSFCYFMARLKDIDTEGKELIIFIDDPISSLDSNHIFFVFSLIESVIAKSITNANKDKTYKYKQLFLATHNLDFFKYLIRLSRPITRDGGTEFFLIEKQDRESTIRHMPKYLKEYQTEFHYLFHQIYRCKDSREAHNNHEVFYNFGNNLRKFLEAYLFYKYPYKDDQDSSTERLMKFFGDDATATALTNRVSNELSHLESIFDRSMHPIEIPEIPAVVNFVFKKMFEKDKDQFNALLKSIGESEWKE